MCSQNTPVPPKKWLLIQPLSNCLLHTTTIRRWPPQDTEDAQKHQTLSCHHLCPSLQQKLIYSCCVKLNEVLLVQPLIFLFNGAASNSAYIVLNDMMIDWKRYVRVQLWIKVISQQLSRRATHIIKVVFIATYPQQKHFDVSNFSFLISL